MTGKAKCRKYTRLLRTLYGIVACAIITGLFACDFGKDEKDAKAFAERIHEQMQAGNYVSIYNQGTSHFKGTGNESQFVAMMQKYQSEAGLLKKAQPIAYEAGVDSNVGKIYVLVYDLEFERARLRERLILTRSEQGQMQLLKLESSTTP